MSLTGFCKYAYNDGKKINEVPISLYLTWKNGELFSSRSNTDG
jgi:hypothetical protein